jgi:hypothetical protein
MTGTDPLPSWNEAAGKVLASEKVKSWSLKAFKYYYIPLKEIGLAGILVEPTADLIRLQDELAEAIGSFFAPAGSGTFTFSAAGASAYQFGNFGTAAKLLHSFDLAQ